MILKKKEIFACVLMVLIFGILIYVSVFSHERTPTRGQLILTFDDGRFSRSIRDHALPVMNQYGFKGIAFFTTKYLSLKEKREWFKPLVQEFIGNGWEIGSHTHTHPHLNSVSEEQLHQEIEYSKQLYETEFPKVNDGLGVITFSYPFGEGWDNETVDSVVTATYRYVRPNKDLRWGKTFSTDKDHTCIQKTQDALNYAKEERVWIWLMFHGVSDNPIIEYGLPETDCKYVVSVKNFSTCMKLIKNSGLSVVTIKDLYQKETLLSQDFMVETSFLECYVKAVCNVFLISRVLNIHHARGSSKFRKV